MSSTSSPARVGLDRTIDEVGDDVGRTPRAYACVYRQAIPAPKHLRRTEEAAATNPLLRRYLDAYLSGASFYDWGDDPAFFGATELLGTPAAASWGVCRRDVRGALWPGDFVVFVCGKESEPRVWDYFLIGVGTVGVRTNRFDVWSDDTYAVHRTFFNVLARPVDGTLVQHETIHEFHPDWLRRAEAPYLIFDRDNSMFDLTDPLHLATYRRADGGIERWHRSDRRVEEAARLLLPEGGSRGLRSTHPQRPHPKMNLAAQAERAGGFDELRGRLLELTSPQPC